MVLAFKHYTDVECYTGTLGNTFIILTVTEYTVTIESIVCKINMSLSQPLYISAGFEMVYKLYIMGWYCRMSLTSGGVSTASKARGSYLEEGIMMHHSYFKWEQLLFSDVYSLSDTSIV